MRSRAETWARQGVSRYTDVGYLTGWVGLATHRSVSIPSSATSTVDSSSYFQNTRRRHSILPLRPCRDAPSIVVHPNSAVEAQQIATRYCPNDVPAGAEVVGFGHAAPDHERDRRAYGLSTGLSWLKDTSASRPRTRRPHAAVNDLAARLNSRPRRCCRRRLRIGFPLAVRLEGMRLADQGRP
jgi:hypothetical protein